MSSRSAKHSNAAASSSSRSISSSAIVSSHVAMVELKQKILDSLSKLADRDTYQIAVEDLEKIVQSLSHETLPMFLNCLYNSCNDPKIAVKKESLRLLSFVCASHHDLSSNHLSRIIANIIKRLRDADSGIRDACRGSIGALSSQYLKGKEGNAVTLVGLFAKPLFEAMVEQNKGLQCGAAMCMAEMIESAAEPPTAAFQKLCPRICRLLNNPNFLAKSSLLPVVASLSQAGAIAPHSLESLLQGVQVCLGSTDWATRKAAADALIALATHSSNLLTVKADSILLVLEACRFDKIKPVRERMTEALNLWKKVAGKDENEAPDNFSSEQSKSEKNGDTNSNSGETAASTVKDLSDGSSKDSDSVSKGIAGTISEKAVLILKKKAPGLTSKALNLNFFQKLENSSGDLPVEVVLPRGSMNVSNSNNEDEPGPDSTNTRGRSNCLDKTPALHLGKHHFGDFARDKLAEERTDLENSRTTEFSDKLGALNSQYEVSSMNSRENWSAVQRQLFHLERQQAHLMNMLQDFIGGSHDGMVTLEHRVGDLERVVEEMARELSVSSGRRSNYAMGFGDAIRSLGKYDGLGENTSSTYNYRAPFRGKFSHSDGNTSGMRGRGPSWRSNKDDMDFSYHKASGTRRAREVSSSDNGSNKSEKETEHASNGRRAWDNVSGPIRLGEGPSARSVWQASKEGATLEAIKIAREENGSSRAARAAIPESDVLEYNNTNGKERDPVWTSWTNAMISLHVGSTDSAYAEVLSTGDDLLLVRLMEKTGPVLDQLSNVIGNKVLDAVRLFLLDQDLLHTCLSWIQQLLEVVLERGTDTLGIVMELKKEILLNLHEASIDFPEEKEGPTPEQLLLQLASAWKIELQQYES